MACRLPHSVTDMRTYVQNQCENDDEARKDAIIRVIQFFEDKRNEKLQMRDSYKTCNDISNERKGVIEKFLKEEARRDDEIIGKLWKCVQRVTNNINTKVNWSYRVNKDDDPGVSGEGSPVDEEALSRLEDYIPSAFDPVDDFSD